MYSQLEVCAKLAVLNSESSTENSTEKNSATVRTMIFIFADLIQRSLFGWVNYNIFINIRRLTLAIMLDP